MPFHHNNTHHNTFGDESGGVRDRLPTLFEVLNLRTRAPVDLWSFYVFMREQYRGVEYLDFWLDVVKHLSLCRNYVRGLRQSLLASERDMTSSRTSSVLLDNLIQDGTLDDTDSRRLSAFLRGEEVDGNQGNLSRLSALLDTINPKDQPLINEYQQNLRDTHDDSHQLEAEAAAAAHSQPRPNTPPTPSNRSSYNLQPPNTSAMAAAWAQEKRRLSGSPIRVVMSDSAAAVAAAASGVSTGDNSARQSSVYDEKQEMADYAMQQHQQLHQMHTGATQQPPTNESFYSAAAPPGSTARFYADEENQIHNISRADTPELPKPVHTPRQNSSSHIPLGVSSSTGAGGPFSTPHSMQTQQRQHLLRQTSHSSALDDAPQQPLQHRQSSQLLQPPSLLPHPQHSHPSQTYLPQQQQDPPQLPTIPHREDSNVSSFVTRNDIKQSTHFILVTYFIPGAEREIVLPQRIMRSVRHAIETEGRDDPEVFDEAREYVFQAMQREAFRSFLAAKALGNTTPFGSVVRLVLGLLSAFGAFWTGFVLIFLDWQPKSTRLYLILPFAFAVYGITAGLYNLDPLLALLGYSETGPARMIRIREPYVRRLLIKRAVFVAAVIILVTACFVLIFALVPGRRL